MQRDGSAGLGAETLKLNIKQLQRSARSRAPEVFTLDGPMRLLRLLSMDAALAPYD
jgi:hypothetical protein